jgi:hypothetical protein
MYYDTCLMNLQQRPWNELNFALCATFHSDLHPHVLERRPKDGPHAFTASQFIKSKLSKWLTGAWRKALDVLRVVAPQDSLLHLRLRLRRQFHGPCGQCGCLRWRMRLQEARLL